MIPAAEGGRRIFSISQINNLVRDILQNELHIQNIWIEGEVSNFMQHASGHIYFTLKDDQSAISCTFFRGSNIRQRELKMGNGMRVQARGGISVYAARGQYQFNVQQVVPAGEGMMRVRIEQLKRKLHAEGLFDASRKKPLPRFPFTLGVATAPTGAALQDIIRVARHRFAGINILLAPCIVQGPEAVDSVTFAIELLNRPELGVDVIIAGRGGGSFEDLLPFNDEAVVRAFAASRVPIVSAVGHEIDHPLADLAADEYAATPSAAVEKVVPVIQETMDRIEEQALRIRYALLMNHKRGKERLRRLLQSRVHTTPRGFLEPFMLQMDTADKEMSLALRARVEAAARRFESTRNLGMYFEARLRKHSARFDVLSERLANFSPLGTLKRGYAIVRDQKKRVIRSTSQVARGDSVEIILGQGRLQARVLEISEE